MVLKRFVFYIVLLLDTLAIGVSATDELGEFGKRESILGSARELFGYAVAVSGDYVLVGRPDDPTRGAHAGAAYVYERRAERWVQVARLLPTEKGQSRFGSAVALDGDVALVGAHGATHDSGAAYIFERRQGVWTHVRKLVPSSIASHNMHFGQSVALVGDHALVGAPGEFDRVAGKQAGAVYVFQRQQGVWGTRDIQKLLASDARAYAGFGARLAVAGSYALVGSPDHDRGRSSADNYGAAYVFELVRGRWYETARLQARDGARRDYFGSAVAMVDQEALIGASGQAGKGAAYVFTLQAGTWTQVHKLTARHGKRGDRFGAAVALARNATVIGAYGHDPQRHHDHDVHADHGDDDDDDDDDLEERAGAAYVFERQTSGWLEVEQLPARQTPHHAHAGYAVALSERHALVGAPALFGGPPGRVYAYSDFRSNAVPQIISTPSPSAAVFAVIPQVIISDAHLSRQTITLNGQPYTPGTPVTVDGAYILTVEATDSAGNTSVATVRFSIKRPPVP